MKNNWLKKILVLVLLMGLILGILPKAEMASAASKPAKPKITVTLSEDGTSVTVKIGKTKRAEGFQIVAKLPGAKEYTEVKTLELDGKKKRSCTIEDLPAGESTIKVRGYAKSGEKLVWGKYSKTKTVTIAQQDSFGFETGDIIRFGSFEQDGKKKNGNEPIDWIVLSNDNGKLFLTSVYALAPGTIKYGVRIPDSERTAEDGKIKDDDKVIDKTFDETWATSGIRTWLNGKFIDTAFTEEEQSIILDTELKDEACTDKVFLLSKDEINNKDYGFTDAKHRAATCSVYAWAYGKYDGDEIGVWVWDGYKVFAANNGETACFWWLRTKTESGEFYVVKENGTLGSSYAVGEDLYSGHSDDDEDIYVEGDGFGIRPALVIKLDEKTKDLIVKTDKTMQEEWKDAGWHYDDDDDDDW